MASWVPLSPPHSRSPYGRPATGPLCGRRVASGCVRGLAAADRAYKRARKRLPPLRVAAPVSGVGLPCVLALPAAWSWVVGLAWGLAMASRPSSSLPSL
ncbi:hypothetical protein BHE74_00006118 [Ensete ventricosum]|nr:hypothetical protein BHE74_00006118 [Ensete ventricosum]